MKRGRIRWPLVAYDMLILLALDVLLLVLYRSSEHLSWSAILLHSGISFVCVFLARSRGSVYQQICATAAFRATSGCLLQTVLRFLPCSPRISAACDGRRSPGSPLRAC